MGERVNGLPVRLHSWVKNTYLDDSGDEHSLIFLFNVSSFVQDGAETHTYRNAYGSEWGATRQPGFPNPEEDKQTWSSRGSGAKSSSRHRTDR